MMISRLFTAIMDMSKKDHISHYGRSLDYKDVTESTSIWSELSFELRKSHVYNMIDTFCYPKNHLSTDYDYGSSKYMQSESLAT